MKAILVVDIPDFVNSFEGVLKPIGTVGKLEIGYGGDDGEMIRYEFVSTDGALLKPVPQELPTPYMMQIMIADGIQTEKPPYTEEYQKGYNDCIKEILGEAE